MPFLLLVYILACDLYFENYMLFILIITLLIINHINCINYPNVREYHRYSLTAYKSLS